MDRLKLLALLAIIVLAPRDTCSAETIRIQISGTVETTDSFHGMRFVAGERFGLSLAIDSSTGTIREADWPSPVSLFSLQHLGVRLLPVAPAEVFSGFVLVDQATGNGVNYGNVTTRAGIEGQHYALSVEHEGAVVPIAASMLVSLGWSYEGVSAEPDPTVDDDGGRLSTALYDHLAITALWHDRLANAALSLTAPVLIDHGAASDLITVASVGDGGSDSPYGPFAEQIEDRTITFTIDRFEIAVAPEPTASILIATAASTLVGRRRSIREQE